MGFPVIGDRNRVCVKNISVLFLQGWGMVTQSSSRVLKAVGAAAVLQYKPEQACGSSGDLLSSSSVTVPTV